MLFDNLEGCDGVEDGEWVQVYVCIPVADSC